MVEAFGDCNFAFNDHSHFYSPFVVLLKTCTLLLHLYVAHTGCASVVRMMVAGIRRLQSHGVVPKVVPLGADFLLR